MRLGRTVAAAAVAAHVLLVAATASQLPERVASHFGADGAANGWMPRDGYVAFMVAFGAGVPLALAGLFGAMRWFPASAINVPNRDYWTAAARRPRFDALLAESGGWLAALVACFLSALHLATLDANAQLPARLAGAALAAVAGGFAAGLALWLANLFLKFRVPPEAAG